MNEQYDLIKKIKEKCEQLSNEESHQLALKALHEEMERFKKIFPLEKLRTMSLEDFDYPKTVNEDKYRNSLMYFIERIPFGIQVGGQRNKQFFYDKNILILFGI